MPRIDVGQAEIVVPYYLEFYGFAQVTALAVNKSTTDPLTQAAADALIDIMIDNLENVATDEYVLGPGWVNDGRTGGVVRIDGTTGGQTGALTETSAPPQVALLVRKNSTAGGRRGRGRMFIPGTAEALLTPSGDMGSTYKADVQSVMDDILSTLQGNANVDDVVILHDTAPFTPTVVTSLQVQTKTATQRRRLHR